MASINSTYIDSYSQNVVNPMLGATYNLNTLSYDTYNINGDKLFGFININDEVYNYNNFYQGDIVVYNGVNYGLLPSDITGYLIWSYSDDNNNNYVTNSEMNLDFNLKAFKEGSPVPLCDDYILFLLPLFYLINKIVLKYKNRKRL